MPDPTEQTESAQPISAGATPVHSLNGAGLLLNILGGLIVGLAVASIVPFVQYVLEPFSIDAVGQTASPRLETTTLALIVYLGFLVNVFRQIHGLGIVFDDDDYQAEVGANLNEGGRVASFFGSVLVLVLVGILLGVVRSTSDTAVQSLLGLATAIGFEPPTWVLIFHLLTVVSYWMWDYVTGKQVHASGGVVSGIRWNAASYAEFAENWKRMTLYSIVLSVAAVLIVVVLSQISASRNVSLVPMIALVFLTFGYSVTDYTCNARFYFRRFKLEDTRALRDEENHVPRRTILIAGAALLAAAVGFLSYRTAIAPPIEPRITLQLKWIYNAGFAGDLVADKKTGWPGLDVDVLAGGIGVDPVKAVTSGSAQFGVATGDQLLQAAEAGAPVVAIALVYQENPLSWIVREESGITGPAGLRARKVGVTFIDDEALFRAMLRRAGLTENDLTIVPVKFDPSPFTSGQIDAYPVFRNTQGVEIAKVLERQRINTRFVGPADVAVISYSNLYFTTREYIEKHPQVVEAFVKGVIEGWRFAQNEPKEAALIVATYDKDNSLDVIEASIRETNALVKLPTTDRIGQMTKEGWEQTQDVLLQAGVLKTRIDLEQLFTTRFVP